MMRPSWIATSIRGVTLFILPLVCISFLPIVEDPYDTGRFILLTGVTIIICTLWTIDLIRTKSLVVSYNLGVAGFGLLTLTSLLSVIFVSPNKIEALIHPLGMITWLCLTIIALIAPTTLEKKDHIQLIWMIVAASSFLGLLIIYQQFAITAMLFPTISYLASPLWNPTGTPISACYLLVLSIPLGIYLLKESGKNHEDRNSAFSLIAILIAVSAIAITLWRYIPLASALLLPIPVGWGILLESWKQPLRAIVGVGADQFISAYTLGKQLSINTTAIWNSAFNTNASLLLHLATVNGVLGVAALLFFAVALVRSKIAIIELPIALFCAIIVLFFFPPSFPIIILFGLLCILVSSEHDTHVYRFTSLGVAFGSIVCLGAVLFSSYHWFRYVRGEQLFYQAVVAKNQENNGTKAYNLMILSMRQSPFISRYHATFSQLNLMLGGAIITSAKPDPTTGKVTVSTEDQQLVTTLFSQAIREGKTATTLAPNNVYMWSNLASIYQNIIGIAADAPSWAIAAYQKAITLDPVNPVLRLDLGGVYVGIKDYDNALQQFTTAVVLKPNYANGYYNLANVLKLKGNGKEAKAALQNVLDLLPSTSNEYQKVSEEIRTFDTTSIPAPVTPTNPVIIPDLTVPK
jgi:hypothetical protein